MTLAGGATVVIGITLIGRLSNLAPVSIAENFPGSYCRAVISKTPRSGWLTFITR